MAGRGVAVTGLAGDSRIALRFLESLDRGTRSFSLGCNRSCLKVSSQELGGSEVTATRDKSVMA